MQDVILDVHRQLDGFSGTTEAEFLGWIKRISSGHVARVHRSYLGAKIRDVSREDYTFDTGACATSIDSVVDAAIQTEEVAWLNCAIDQLPEYHRRVVELRMDGRTFREIANDMDRSVDSVQKLWARGLVKLRDALAKPDSNAVVEVPLAVVDGHSDLPGDSCS